MTNKEFASITSAETEFIEILNKVFTGWYVGKNDEEFSRFSETALGKYLWRTHDIVSEIDQNIADMKFAKSGLQAYDPGISILQRQENAAHGIRYHYENYILRTTKIKDLSLCLINQVMQLEIKKRLSMENQIPKRLDPQYGNFGIIWGHMKTLTDHIKPYRNHLAHNGTVNHKDLTLLNVHYTLGDIKHKDIKSEIRHEAGMAGLQRELVEKFTGQIDAYLNSSDQVLKLIYLYLAKPLVDNLDILVDQHNQKPNK